MLYSYSYIAKCNNIYFFNKNSKFEQKLKYIISMTLNYIRHYYTALSSLSSLSSFVPV